jgi:hypothetical protein
LALLLVFAVFLAVYFKKGNGILAFSIASGVMLFVIVIAPFNETIGHLNYHFFGKSGTYPITWITLKLFMVGLSFASIIVVNWALFKAKIKYPYGKSKGDPGYGEEEG